MENLPAGDVLLHAGDFTNCGSLDQIMKFSQQMKELDAKFTYKVLIAGNHELTFDPQCSRNVMQYLRLAPKAPMRPDPREFINNCIYLEDSYVELFGIKVYGAPWLIIVI